MYIIERERDCKELAHAIIEADKPHDLYKSVSWRPSKADGIHSNPKAGRLKTQEGPVYLLESEGRRKLMSRLKGSQAEGVPLTQVFFFFF